MKMSTCLGIIGCFLFAQLQLNNMKQEEGIILFQIIITGYIKILEMVFVPFIGLHVDVKPVLLNLIKIGSPNCAPYSTKVCPCENCYYNKVLSDYKDCIIM